MKQVNVHEAKTHLSHLLEQVIDGKEIVISKAGKPIAKLVSFDASGLKTRKPGLMKGKIKIRKDFDCPF